MDETPAPAKPRGEDSNRTERVVLIVSVALSAISAVAAAYSAIVSQQGLAQSQDAQLLNQRLSACVELDQRATDRIAEALTIVTKGPQLYDSYDWYGEDYYACPAGSPEARAACEKANAEKLQRQQEVARQAVVAFSDIEELRFQSARRFDLLAAPGLAAQEAKLSSALTELSKARAYEHLIKDDRAVIALAIQAQQELRAACANAVGRFALSE